MGVLIAFGTACIVLVEFLVQGVKEWLPARFVDDKQRIWSLVFSLLVVRLPAYITSVSVPEQVKNLTLLECILLGILISRGSQAWFGLLRLFGVQPDEQGGIVKSLFTKK